MSDEIELEVEQALFAATLEFSDPAHREAFLEKACAGDPSLRARIQALLDIDTRAEIFLDSVPLSHRPDLSDVKVPAEQEIHDDQAHIGPYRIVRRLGEGGCGVVYLAEQEVPVRRSVALKIVRLGMDTERIISRFLRERQALAMMSHPCIARIYDAGATDSGRPYFAMELVEGERITTYGETHRLTIQQRLELFIQVCLAVQHAHQKGVLHRDLKPSNVLVTGQDDSAIPKVIDFGIAKTIDPYGETPEDITHAAEQFMGTPAYMSPEQAAEGRPDVDTRADIYGLGALLYELLAGRPPFDAEDLMKQGFDVMRRTLREVDPPPPSALLRSLPADELAILADRRQCTPAALIAMLRYDLNWIVMKAMEKDRQRRYATAHGLAMDVQRHLRHESVSASPPGRRYQLRKLIRRNRVAFTAGSFVVLALAAGFGTSTWRYIREKEARREADRARANESMLRERAELREALAQAAVKIQHGDLAGADALMARVPVEQTPSSLEAANAFQGVGEWHVMAGRWDMAADRFASVARAMTSVDPSDTDAVSRTLLPAAATLCQSGNRERYEWFREMAIERFAGTSNPVVAEQILKAALLVPADQKTLRALRPLGEITEQAIERSDGAYSRNPGLVSWGCFSLALLNFREGNDARATDWAERCLAVPSANLSRQTSVRLILAMIAQRSGHTDAARVLLAAAAPLVRERFSRNMQLSVPNEGFWFDWVNARILLHEASELITN